MRVTLSMLLVTALAVSATASDLERNKDLVRRFVSAMNERRFAALDDLVAADVRRHSTATPGVDVRSLQDFKAFLRQDLVAVPDSRQEIEDMVAEGDKVAVRVVYRGTQTGPMGPFPPSGRSVELPFMGILRISQGKIAELWVEWDNVAMLTQLGHLSPPGVKGAAEGGEAPGAVSEEAKKALARRWFDEVINDRDLDVIDDIYAADYRYHGQGGQELHGPDAVRSFAAAILAASDDRHAVVEQQVVEDDLVVTRFVSRGRQTGVWQGRPPTGEVWTTEGIVISRVSGGKIVEDWEVIAHAGL